MRKIWAIALKDIRLTFTDGSLLGLMFAAPLALATIIGVTFGGASAGGSAFTGIPVAIVNQDEGTAIGNFGDLFTTLLAPDAGITFMVDAAAPNPQADPVGDAEAFDVENPLSELIAGVVLDDPDAARAGVLDGTYVAAVLIPSGFSAGVSPNLLTAQIAGAQVQVYGNPDRPIAAGIVRDVVRGITDQIAAGSISISAVITTLIEENPSAILTVTNSDAFNDGIAQAFQGITTQVSLEQENMGGQTVGFNPLVFIGSAQAIFFAIFTASGAAASVLEEQRDGTLPRLIVTPTTRLEVLLGKMGGTFAAVVAQLVFLFIGFTLIGSVLAGELQFIWGNNLPAVAAVLLATALAATGLGTIVAAASRTPDQAGSISTVIAIGMGILGGAFGFQLSFFLEQVSIVYWGSQAFTRLAMGNPDVGLHVVVMLIFGAVSFAIGLIVFNRRLNV